MKLATRKFGSDLDRTNLHEPNIYFIACPAVANFLVGIVICPLTLYQHFEKCGISSIRLCRFWNWIDVVETVSIYTLTFISCETFVFETYFSSSPREGALLLVQKVVKLATRKVH